MVFTKPTGGLFQTNHNLYCKHMSITFFSLLKRMLTKHVPYDLFLRQSMDVLVKGNGLSKSCDVVCPAATRIRQVKQLFEQELGIPHSELRLFFGHEELEDMQKVGDFSQNEMVDLCFLRRDPEQAKWLEALFAMDLHVFVFVFLLFGCFGS